eukprot:scaffold34015_cov54-Attheya_sp.AAC.4
MMRLIGPLFLALLCTTGHAFSGTSRLVTPATERGPFFVHETDSRRPNMSLAAAAEASSDAPDPIECFVVNDETEGQDPQVVCTSEPEEYAWFNGIKPSEMKPTDGVAQEGFNECVEGASPKGTPEWECKK